MRPTMRLILLAVTAIATVGCETERGTLPAAPVLTDSAGVVIATSGPDDRALPLQVREVFVMGATDQTEFFRLSPQGLAGGPGGEIAVLDQGNFRVVVFDGSGQPTASFGREGEGPGEFRYPSGITVDRAGVVRVFDLTRRVEIRYSLDGAFLGEIGVPPGFRGGQVSGDDRRTVYAAYDAGRTMWRLTAVDSLGSTVIREVGLPEQVSATYESCGLRMGGVPLFARSPVWDAEADAIAIVTNGEYSVQLIDGDGVVRMLRRSLPRIRATEDMALEDLGEGERIIIGISEECVVPPREVLEQRGMAEYLPTVTGVRLRPNGQLWVQRFELGSRAGPVDVFDREGNYRGTLNRDVPWPDRFLTPDTMIVLERDSLDVERVVVFQIVD